MSDAHGSPAAARPERSPLAIADMTVAYGKRPVLWDVDYSVPEPTALSAGVALAGDTAHPGRGHLVAIVGPNGAGKSTMLKACLGLLPLATGTVRFFGQPLAKVRDKVAYVPQRESVDWDFPVSALDVVCMGGYRALGWLRPVDRATKAKALACLGRVGIAELASRQIGQLSGGQQQRVFIARALMQDAALYLMDEPFAGVDAATERAILAVLADLRDRGASVLCVHHDLQTVAGYFDHAVLINTRIIAHGPVASALTSENLRLAYGGRLTLLDRAGDALAGRGLGAPVADAPGMARAATIASRSEVR